MEFCVPSKSVSMKEQDKKTEKEIDRSKFDSMDSVDRRDTWDHIVSKSFTERGKENFDKIKWKESG